MEMNQFGYAGFFFVFGILFVAGGLIANWLLRPDRPSAAKSMPYECGEIPIGGAWVQFHVGYYLIALVFVLFEVEVAFLFPWASLYKAMDHQARVNSLTAVLSFIGVLALADAYAWKKGALEWL
jgi:NADH-quinone oxidoreductase subunit A